VQDALAKRSLTDGLSADLRIATETEMMLCLADAGDMHCVREVTELQRRDARHIVTAWRVFISLVNAARFDEARVLQQAAGLYAPHDVLAADLRLDALFTTAVLALQAQADWPRAAAIFTQLRHALLRSAPANNKPHHLFWPALRGELIAFTRLERRDEAIAVLQQCLQSYAGAAEDLMREIIPASAPS
jgi:hypothetical protein